MNWIAFIAISIISGSIASIIQKSVLSKYEIDAKVAMIFFQLSGSISAIIFALLFSFEDITSIISSTSNEIVIRIIFSTGLYAIGSLSMFKALKMMDASKFTIIFGLRAFFTILVSSIFLKETLNNLQILGSLFIFLSIIVVTIEKTEILKSFDKNETYAFLAAITFGVAVSNDKVVFEELSAISYLIIGFLLPGIYVLFSEPKIMKKFRIYLNFNLFLKSYIFTIFYLISSLTFIYAITSTNNSSLIAAVNQIQIVITVILGIIILNEKNYIYRKIIGVIISFVGLIFLAI